MGKERFKATFSKGKYTVTTALQSRFGQTGITDLTELEIPGRTKFLVIFDEGKDTEERWYIPDEFLTIEPLITVNDSKRAQTIKEK